MAGQINVSDVFDTSTGFNGIMQHACSSTEGIIAWVVVWSLWVILFGLINLTDEKHLAVGAASFVGLFIAIGFAIFGCGGSALIILMLVLAATGIAIGAATS